MIRSMTGFGHGEMQTADRKFTVEIKAVNHRYFDVNIRLPRTLNRFDGAIRSILKEYIQRGKVDVYITLDREASDQVKLTYHEDMARQYLQYLNQMAGTFDISGEVSAARLASFPEVLSLDTPPEDEEELWHELETAVREACVSFTAAREKEGDHLCSDLTEKLENMLRDVGLVEKRYPAVMESYRERLKEKLREILEDSQIDENRVAAELVIYSDKICTDEETVRLKSHISTMLHVLKEGGFIGRKLDFIAQEMNREANTILSKANDLETSNLAIGLKTEIEKVREQIQNIE